LTGLFIFVQTDWGGGASETMTMTMTMKNEPIMSQLYVSHNVPYVTLEMQNVPPDGNKLCGNVYMYV